MSVPILSVVPVATDHLPLRDATELRLPFELAEVPERDFRVGLEAERFGVSDQPPLALGYEGARGVRKVLLEFMSRGWQAERESEASPLLELRRDGASLTLEPGAQLELSGAPYADVHGVATELAEHQRELTELSEPLGLRWLSVGFHPLASQEQLPWVPKPRYPIMREYLPTRGTGALDMMLRTATVQVNLDYSSETDALAKLQLLLRVAPMLHAATANSPWIEGRATGRLSERGQVWMHMDPSRSGLIESVFNIPDPGYHDYIEWALDAGMFLIKRGDHYVANTGQTFRDFMRRGFAGHRATLADWKLHLNTLFPEVRLKRTLELRSIDAQPADTVLAIPALTTGLCYDKSALADAGKLLSFLTFSGLNEARPALVREGLRSQLMGRELQPLMLELLGLARGGLQRRARLDAQGRDETQYLEGLEALWREGHCPAERLLAQVGPNPTTEAIANATRIA